ncbi:trimethylamine---corrinoid protein Co-methyltransferase [Desulfitobacterium chlororespirans DSM 11544]|uniref:Trimethylamine---corrinoid protein Co-methyltransferase n=1 Tax=Desulfitobacterium chlororespirans DSM 11544 TaxID=1121395 RepID=A0A1M7TDX0_9FIRM|nr:trimethylamine---corrinoid protein Co-methyltransferase [Desulfitobacterium chlororespirans DSM 11544]
MRSAVQAGVSRMEGFGLTGFSDEELYAIHTSTLEVLEYTGLKIESQEALEIFSKGGARVDFKTKVVKIPQYLVEEALSSAPSVLMLAGRNPKNDLVLGGKRVGFINFGEGVSIIDPYTKEYRKTTKQDVADITRFCDAMDQMDAVLRPVAPQDIHPSVAVVHNAEVIFNNTSKHVFIGVEGGRNFKKVLKMAAAIAGGEEKLRDRPLFSCNICPTSPLQIVSHASEVIIEGARAGIPVNMLSMGMSGATSAITLAGTLVTHNCEVLGGIVLSQLTSKGAPVLYGSSTTIMDMKNMTAPVGSPELGMINAGVAKLAQYYNLPSWVAGG